MRLKAIYLTLFCLLLAVIACGGGSSAATETPPPEPTVDKTIYQTQTALAEEVENMAATEEAIQQQTAVVLTEEAMATPTIDYVATDAAFLNSLAAEMELRVQQVYEDGYISKTEGEYFPLSEFNESWAQINWYQWWDTGYTPANFVIRTDAEWESASTSANFFTSGCGFVFREDGVDNHYLIYLGMDGNVYLTRIYKGNPKMLGFSFYKSLDIPADSAELILAVDNDRITFYVDGQMVRSWRDDVLDEGNLGLTLMSGINTGFGTRCSMTDIDLWILDP